MKSQANCFWALVLAFLVLASPAAAIDPEGSGEPVLAIDAQQGEKGDRGDDLGDVYDLNGDPDDIAGGDNFLPGPVKRVDRDVVAPETIFDKLTRMFTALFQ